MFLTRLPVGKSLPNAAGLMQQTPRYFTLVGLVVGGIQAAATIGAYVVFQNAALAIALGMLAAILTTGAFHEDGLADTCDAFGGGWSRERILEIMKDSRIGSFGTVGLVAALGIRFLALQNIPLDVTTCLMQENTLYQRFVLITVALLAGHSLSRLMAVTALQTHPYAGHLSHSKSKPLANQPPGIKALLLATAIALLPMLLVPWHYLLALLPMYLVRTAMLRYFTRWIGGYTGDCLGAIQQVTEIVFYLCFMPLARWVPTLGGVPV